MNTDRKEQILSLALIVLAVALCYGRTIGYGFLQTWDDDAYVVNNTAAHGFSLPNLTAAFSTFYVGNYAPLHIVSYMLDYTFWELNPAGYHAGNLLLHALNGFLLLHVLRKTLDNHNTALLATLIFIVHPVQVESVAWVSERKNLLGFLFIMLTLACHIRWRNDDVKKYYWFSLAMTGAALLSKSVAVIIPLVLATWDYCYCRRQDKASFVRKWAYLAPHLLLCAIAALLAMKSQQPEHGGGRVGYINDSAAAHLLTMVSIAGKYTKNLLWPSSLSSFYDAPVVNGLSASLLFGMLILSAITALAFYLHRKDKPLFFCLTLAVAAMLPVSNIIPLNTFINDRYLYLPMAGISALVATFIFRLVTQGRGVQNLAIAAICLPLALISRQQCETWKSDIDLWKNAVHNTPKTYLLLQSSVALNALAAAYLQEGRIQESKQTSQLSLIKNPDNVIALNNLGMACLQMEQLDTAEYFLRKAIAKQPDYAQAYVNLAKTFITAGKYDSASETLAMAVRFAPENAGIHGMQAALYLISGNLALARQQYTRSEQLGGSSKDISFGRACIEAMEGNSAKALEYLELAFRQGFRGKETLRSSNGLDSIRNLPEYRELLSKYGMD